MRKLIRGCTVISFLAIFLLNLVEAKEFNSNTLSYVDVYVNGQVFSNIQETIETIASVANQDDNIILNNKELESLDSYNPPRTAVENNIVLLIVSFIICMTATIGIGHRMKKIKAFNLMI
ncbi:MAG: hypothetical protein J6A89_07320 [Clostridia bacterium]|nr:hypothetical protein [Clostridia bacterium]